MGKRDEGDVVICVALFGGLLRLGLTVAVSVLERPPRVVLAELSHRANCLQTLLKNIFTMMFRKIL